MTKKFALVASMVMLMTISGEAFAETAAPNAWYGVEASRHADQQTVHAFNTLDRAVATETAEPSAYRYHGGPKSND